MRPKKSWTQIFNKRYTDGIDWSYSYEGLPEILEKFQLAESLYISKVP